VGIVVETLEQASMVEMIRLDRKLWLTADKSKVVEDGDLDAAFLYGVEGTLKPKPEAEELGALPKSPQKKAAEKRAEESEKQADKTEDKQAEKSSNK
jgi:hypothetical protein